MSLDGMEMYCGNDRDISIDATAGIYAVSNGNTTAKVMVR